jgi:hypothetical protein
MRAKLFIYEDEDGFPEEFEFHATVRIPKPLRFAVGFALLFGAAFIAQVGK